MRYVLVDEIDGVPHGEECNIELEAIYLGESRWNRMSKEEKDKRSAYYVLDRKEPWNESSFVGKKTKEWK